jgi:hypothetical protein
MGFDGAAMSGSLTRKLGLKLRPEVNGGGNGDCHGCPQIVTLSPP